MNVLYGAFRNSDVPKRLDTTHIGAQECIKCVFIYIIINEEEDVLNDRGDIIIIAEEMDIPDPPVNCHVINNNEEVEVEEDEGKATALVEDEEEQQQHLINYAVSLPVVDTDLTR
jgi:hypothetical protein